MEMSPYLLLGFLMAGLLHAFIPSSLIARYMGGESLASVVRGALVGVPLPLCSCGVLPVAASARQAGAGKGPTLAFLISTPVTGIDSILATAGVLGIVFTIARIVASFVMGIAAGVASIFFPGPAAPPLPAEPPLDSPPVPEESAIDPPPSTLPLPPVPGFDGPGAPSGPHATRTTSATRLVESDADPHDM